MPNPSPVIAVGACKEEWISCAVSMESVSESLRAYMREPLSCLDFRAVILAELGQGTLLQRIAG